MYKNFEDEIFLEHHDFVELNLAEVDLFEAGENLSARRVCLHVEDVALKASSQRRRPTQHLFDRFPKKFVDRD